MRSGCYLVYNVLHLLVVICVIRFLLLSVSVKGSNTGDVQTIHSTNNISTFKHNNKFELLLEHGQCRLFLYVVIYGDAFTVGSNECVLSDIFSEYYTNT
jgi:hypothetical protein